MKCSLQWLLRLRLHLSFRPGCSLNRKLKLSLLVSLFTLVLMSVMLLQHPIAAEAACVAGRWPLWQAFANHHLQADGRIVDFNSSQQHSTSEGQSYGMFFALVANDRPAFVRMLAWTDTELAGGELGQRLPAWQWNAAQGVLDPNTASDADLWLAYDLLEAGRLWHEPAYTQRAYALMNSIAAREVINVDGLGPVLLPGTIGFVGSEGQLRLNPSYSPLPLLRRLNDADPAGPWLALAASSTRMLAESTPRGVAADWVVWQPGVGFMTDDVTQAGGSYDAIRSYLWLGMDTSASKNAKSSTAADQFAKLQSASLSGMGVWLATHAEPPEKFDSVNGSASGTAQPGFRAAVLPYLKSSGEMQRHAALYKLVAAQLALYQRGGAPELTYYDLVLSLFGFGWSEGQYRFSPTGELHTRWESTCHFSKKN